MKTSKKVLAVLLALALVLSLAACGGGESSSTASTPANEDTSSAASTPEESTPASEPADDETESEPEESTTGSDELVTPRNETVYLGGIQWGKPVAMNPLSPSNNFSGIAQTGIARQFLYETLYMYNPIDGVMYPLLADGDPQWADGNASVTIKLKEAAAWSDGAAFTADDVAATFDAHVKAESTIGNDYGQYIDSVVADDEHTVTINLKADNLNPHKINAYLTSVYQMQKDYLDKCWSDVSDDSGEMKNLTMWDAPHTGAYNPVLYDSEQKWVCERDDNYWGQDASMWGKLPVPKYLAHNIYKDNDATQRAFEAGEIDIDQQYCSNLQDMWETKGLAVSTWFDEAPYQIGMSMPSAIFNCTREGLDQAAVRKAIAMAVDYDQIVASAMTGQSYTFTEVPRSLCNPTDGEQALIKDPEALKPYQFAGKDIEGANAVLDEAGIVDTDGDGIREYPAGNNLSFKAKCPQSYSDWTAALTILSDCGKDIGIQLETDFVEVPTYTSDIQTGNFDITLSAYEGANAGNPYIRAYATLYGFGGNMPETTTINYSRFYSAEAEELLAKMAVTTDEDEIKDILEQLNIIYLTEVPCTALMYRPADFHEVNEVVWTNFPEAGNEDNIPPLLCLDGYGYAGMFNIELVEG